MSGISDRQQEIHRRRHRKQKVAKLKARYAKATASERQMIIQKIRALTPGADVILRNWGVEER